jgi:hypothetical protein
MTPETQKSSHDIMADRILSCLDDEKTSELVTQDFYKTFLELGLSEIQANELVFSLFQRLKRASSGDKLMDTESTLRRLIEKFSSRKKPILDELKEKLAGRANLIFTQVEPDLRQIIGESTADWPLLDWGCGDGEVTRRIHERLGMPVSSSDVRDYRSEKAKGSDIPFFEVRNNQLYSDGKLLKPGERLFRVGLMTNVAHHEAENEKLLEALSEYISDYLIVIETVPDPRSGETEQIERDRTFMNDYLYNRLFHDADVPVPGTYETRKGWVDRFAKHGWELQGDIVDLGIDQPTIQDYHVMYVFKRNQVVSNQLDVNRTGVQKILT